MLVFHYILFDRKISNFTRLSKNLEKKNNCIVVYYNSYVQNEYIHVNLKKKNPTLFSVMAPVLVFNF